MRIAGNILATKGNLWTAAIRGWLGSGPRITEDLDRLAQSLAEITHRTEPEFVDLTGVLKGLYSSAVDLSRETRAPRGGPSSRRSMASAMAVAVNWLPTPWSS